MQAMRKLVMIEDYKFGSMLFYDGDLGRYFYGSILSVKADVINNRVHMKVLNKNDEVSSLNLDNETMKQWKTK